jgi:uncharacterized membrane protein
MANSKSLSKLRLASRICKISAVIIGVGGFIATALYITSIIPVLRQYQYQGGQNSFEYLSFILPLFLFIVPTFFFVVVLYAIAALMDFMRAETKPEQKQQKREEEDVLEDDESLEIVPLPADMR